MEQFGFNGGQFGFNLNFAGGSVIVYPLLTAASIEDAQPTKLNLTFSKAVSITTTGWTINTDGDALSILSVSGSLTTIPIFTLSRAILNTETITLTYNSAIGDTTDIAANPLASFINSPVTNNVNPAYVGSVPMSHDQYYILPEDAENNDYLGQFHINKVDTHFNVRTGVYSYAIIAGNTGNIFAINSTTGLITINDKTSIVAGPMTLTIRTSIDGINEDYSAFINIIAAANCHYCNFATGSAANPGTRALPKKYMYDFNGSRITGHGYFMARGTNEVGGTTKFYAYTNTCYYGSYGTGANGKITGLALRVGQYGTTNGNQNAYFYDIDIADNIVEVMTDSNGCEFHRMNFTGATANGGIYEYEGAGLEYPVAANAKLYDSTSTTSLSHGYKLGKGWTVVNVETYNNATNGITTQGGSSSFLYLYSHDNSNQYGIELDNGNTTVDYSVFDGNANNVEFAWQVTNNNEINSNNLVKRCIIQNGINYQVNLEAVSDATNTLSDNTIDSCIIRNGLSGGVIIKGPHKNFTVQNCSIYGNAGNGINFDGLNLATNIYINRNVIYSNANGIVVNNYTYNDTVYFDANTVLDNIGVDIVLNSASMTINLRDTIYETITNLSNADVQTTNYVAVGGADFVNRASNDYHLALGATPIGAGTDIGYVTDRDGVAYAVPPSIGAYEYV